jgi:hypothetical protein
MRNGMSTTDEQIVATLQQYPSGPPVATQQLRQYVTPEDRRGRALLAWMLTQQSEVDEASQITLELVEGGGVAYLPQWVGQNLIGQGTPELRQRGVILLGHALTDSVGIDPFSVAQQLVSQGEPAGAVDLINRAVDARPPYEPALADILSRARAGLAEIRKAREQALREQERAVHDIGEVRRHVKSDQQRLERIVQEVGGLASKSTSLIQAREYGERAMAIEKRANRYTVSAIVLGVCVAALAVVLGVIAAASDDPLESALEKLPITIPFLLLNIYIGRLAMHFREEAIRLRHIELQIRAATPFLEALDEGPRKAVLAMLALRFFPGQSLPDSSGESAEPPDIAEALGTLLSGRGVPGGQQSAPPTPGPPVSETPGTP